MKSTYGDWDIEAGDGLLTILHTLGGFSGRIQTGWMQATKVRFLTDDDKDVICSLMDEQGLTYRLYHKGVFQHGR